MNLLEHNMEQLLHGSSVHIVLLLAFFLDFILDIRMA